MGFGLIINKTFISPFSIDNWGRIFERISKIPLRFLLAHLHTGAEILSKLKILPKVSSQQAVSLQRRLNDSSTFESDVVKSQPMPWSKILHQLLLNDNFKIFQSFLSLFMKNRRSKRCGWRAKGARCAKSCIQINLPLLKLTTFL